MNFVIVVASVTTGWRWLAVLIALGFIALLYAFVSLATKTWDPRKLYEGFDGLSSTSKFQWMLWLVVVLFAYTVLWILRAKQGDYSAVPDVPAHVLVVLGFSTATAAAAKGIKGSQQAALAAQAQAGAAVPGAAPAVAAAPPTGGLFQDDTAFPELAKIQMIGFTFIAVAIFLTTVIHQIATNPPITSLPDIDSTLMALMGISQGGYLAKKVVSP